MGLSKISSRSTGLNLKLKTYLSTQRICKIRYHIKGSDNGTEMVPKYNGGESMRRSACEAHHFRSDTRTAQTTIMDRSKFLGPRLPAHVRS